MVEKEGDIRNIELRVSNYENKTISEIPEKNLYQLPYDDTTISHKVDNIHEMELKKTDKVVVKSVDQLIDKLGITWYNMRIYLILSLFFLADGAEMIVISLLVSKLGSEWNLSHNEKGLMGSAVFIGFFVGALISGKFSDTKGRKLTFIIGAFIVCVFATGSALAPNYISFLFLRAMNGFGIGMCIPSSTSLATEITPTEYRSWVLNLVWIFFPFGEIFAVLVAQSMLETNNGWRYLLGWVALPTIFAFILSLFIFESPKYYLAIKKYDKAFEGLNRMLRVKKFPELSTIDKEAIIKENESSLNNSINPNFKTLLEKNYLSLTIKCCIIFYVSSFVYYGVVYILPQTMEAVSLKSNINSIHINTNNSSSNSTKNISASENESNFSLINSTERSDMYKGLILSALSEIPSTLLTGYISNLIFLGRIRSMAYGMLLTSFSAVLCAIFLNNLSITASLLKFSIDIPFGVIYTYVTEAFPTKIRSIANGVTNSFNRIGGITTPIVSQWAFSYSVGMPYFVYAFVAIIGAFCSFILPFETLGREIN